MCEVRKFIAGTIFLLLVFPVRTVFINPLCELMDFIYPGGTESRIYVWPDPRDPGKIRFAFRYCGFLAPLRGVDNKGVGIKIPDWEKLVKNIETQIIWKQK